MDVEGQRFGGLGQEEVTCCVGDVQPAKELSQSTEVRQKISSSNRNESGVIFLIYSSVASTIRIEKNSLVPFSI